MAGFQELAKYSMARSIIGKIQPAPTLTAVSAHCWQHSSAVMEVELILPLMDHEWEKSSGIEHGVRFHMGKWLETA